MYLALLQDARLYAFLLQADRDLADTAQRSVCRFCGGRLHSACYRRKPRGVPDGIDPGPAFPVRFSFCCRVDGCRRRHTPPSVRFLGRKVYLSVMVVLLTTLRQAPTGIQSIGPLHSSHQSCLRRSIRVRSSVTLRKSPGTTDDGYCR